MTAARFSSKISDIYPPTMADPNDPKKETVRIDLPPPVAKPPDPTTKSREAVRIQLPIRQPSDTASLDRKSTRLNSSHSQISYAVFCLKKKTLHLSKCYS